MEKEESRLQKAFLFLTGTVRPNEKTIIEALAEYRKAHPSWTRDELAEKWADRICWLYASEGAVSALPGAIPGFGTGVQIGIEGGAITADLFYMIRCMAGMVSGVAIIYDRGIRTYFNDEFLKILGLWCGVLLPVGETTVRIASKIAIAQFKRVPAEVFKKVNRKVGVTILTKYGTKRGGIAVGHLIPFGVGALVGGAFNLATMKGFKVVGIKYFKSDDELAMPE